MANNRDYKEYESWLDSENSSFTQFKKNISAVQIIALIGALYLAWYMLKTGGPNSKWYMIGVGVVVLIILFKPNKVQEQQPIPENVIKILTKIQLERKIGTDVEFPTGSVVILQPQCNLRFQGEWGQPFVPWKWEVGFQVKSEDGLIKDYLCILHPYRGYVTGIKEMPYGYDGSTSNDLKILMPSIMKTDNQQSGLSVTK